MNGSYVKISEAASYLGLSADTVRRRIHRGELEAVQMTTRSGKTWFVWIDASQMPQATAISNQPSDDNGDSPPPQTTWRRELSDLVLLVSRLQAENRDLAGRVGYLEAELQHARTLIKILEEELVATGRGHRKLSSYAG